MSDSDDDLLALADVGSESEDDVRISQPAESEPEEAVNPYPLEGKYKDAEDRAELLALPEIEREEILYERAQEVQRFEERRYLAQRRRQMQRVSDSGPASKRQRGTVGVSSGTKSSLQELKKRREAQSRRSKRSGVSDDEYSEPESESEDSDEFGSDVSEGETRRRRSSRGSDVEWADDDEEEDEVRSATITLDDVNKIRWGKTLFAKYAHHPGFADAVPGCFVRVNIGVGRAGEPVYRMCQVRRVVPHSPYTFLGRTVDEAIIASMAGSERTLQLGICSDSPIKQAEFDFWVSAMGDAGIALPPRRRAEAKFNEIRALSKHALTAQEVDEMVQRRQRLSGQRGANAVLEMADLRQRRELALEQGDMDAVAEIDAKLRPAENHPRNDGGKDVHQDKLVRVNERNRRANVESVRKAEIQAQAERRKAGAAQKADPFSRLRTTARIFYKAGEEPSAEVPQMTDDSKSGADLGHIDTSVPLAAVDDMIAQLDVKIDIDI